MQNANSLSDSELLSRMPILVRRERAASAEFIEHLVEVERRSLFLGQACSSLWAYCRERLGYSEDEASKRVRVARLARTLPAALEELRAGNIHLTGLFLLAQHATLENSQELFDAARGKSRREIEFLLAARFPKGDVSERLQPTPDTEARLRAGVLEPLSGSTFNVQFMATTSMFGKIEQAKELLSHSIPNGELAPLFERALDELIAKETRRRLGAGVKRKPRPLKEGSRHVPVEVARAVWTRDQGRCSFVDDAGHRCTSRRYITLEHRLPFAAGGASDPQNLCLLCRAHNQYRAREAFGTQYIARKRAARRADSRPDVPP